MGRKKENKIESSRLKEETRHWIFAILSLVTALFFVLAASGNGGLVGSALYGFVELLFGWGYFLFPIILFILSVVLFKKIKPSFVITTVAGTSLLFVSGLGLLSVIYDKGGVIGSLLSKVLEKIFDFYAAVIILVAIFFISLLMTFDTTPPVHKLVKLLTFWKKEKVESDDEEEEEDEYEEEEEYEDKEEEEDGEEDADEEEEEGDEEDSEEEAPKKSLKTIFSFGSKKRKGNLNTLEGFCGEDNYTPPPLSILRRDKGKPETGDIKANANIIKRTLQNFGIDVEMDEVSVGPSVTRYALKPAQGVKLSRIVGLQNDLALALAAQTLRIEAPIPGKSLVGIEVPNSTRTTVGLASLFSEDEFEDLSKPLLLSMGRSVTGKPYFGDLAKMPHLLIAGTTGSGKSVSIHAIIASLIFRNSPRDLRLIMIDPKRVELTMYNKIPHLLTPVITNAKKAILALKWAAKEMDRRYDVLETESVRDISSYHKNIVTPAYTAACKKRQSNEDPDDEEEDMSLPEKMPYIVIIMDELADIMGLYPRELEAVIVRLAQMSRAVGIHLILSTQRPSVNVITGLIKANVPARVAFQVASQTDSRTIIDMGGAEKLLGAGDMLYSSGEMSKPVRLQSAFVSETEIKKIVNYIVKECGEPDFAVDVTDTEQERNSLFEAISNDTGDEDGNEDDLFESARETVLEANKASTTFLQRKLRIGYARAARLMDMLEERGVVGPADGARPREVYRDAGEGYGE